MQTKIRMRRKSQLTLPEQIVRKLDLKPGDELIVRVDEDQPEVIKMRPLHRSYAGACGELYGTPEEARAYVRAERESWEPGLEKDDSTTRGRDRVGEDLGEER